VSDLGLVLSALGCLELFATAMLPATWVGRFAWLPLRGPTTSPRESTQPLVGPLHALVLARATEPVRAKQSFVLDLRLSSSRAGIVARFRVRSTGAGMEVQARCLPIFVFSPWLIAGGAWLGRAAEGPVARPGVGAVLFFLLMSAAFALSTRRFLDQVDGVTNTLFALQTELAAALHAESVALRRKELPSAPPRPKAVR
jgi:hypothetical protein